MDRSLLDIVVCPACGGPLMLGKATTATVQYEAGPREEVKSGQVECGNGHRYSIEDFVLSFAAQFPESLKREAAFWDRYYLWLLEQGSYGFHDLRKGHAPYITQGVPEPFPLADTLDRYDIHYRLAEHPLLRRGSDLLDIGVGLGWTSLHFARAGYSVTAFEPSLGPVTAAKRYAIEQGVFIEYMCAAMGALDFRHESFDVVTAFHSLHHVPDLETELCKIRTWLRPGGTLAIDEHTGNSKLASAIATQMNEWAQAEVLPRYRTIPEEAMSTLPTEPHSANEDASVDKIVPLVERMFTVEHSQSRHVFLDHFPLLYYLAHDRDEAAFPHSLEIANRIQEFVRQADPEGGDYITLIATNTAPPAVEPEQAIAQPQVIAPTEEQQSPIPENEQQRIAELESTLAAQGEWAKGLEAELRKKNAEIASLKAQMHRIENGMVMRLLRRINMKRKT